MPREPSVDLGQLYTPFNQQNKAHIAKERFTLYGGAFGGGKTVWGVNECIQLCLDYPGNRGYACRHELPAFRRSVLLEFEKYIHPAILAQHHQTENYFKINTAPYTRKDTAPSYIYYGGLGDDKAGLARLASMTLGFFFIDQAEDTSESHLNMLDGRLRLSLPNIHYRALLTCNPAPGWLKQRFIEQKLDDHIFIQSLPKDNPYLPADYESGLRKRYPPEWVAAMLEGSWEALEHGNFVFSYSEITKAIDRDVSIEGPPCMGVDLAWGGADESIAVIRQGGKVLTIERWKYRKEDSILSANKVIELMHDYNIEPKNVNIDAISGGSPIYSEITGKGYAIKPIGAGEEADDKKLYVNKRAEMYYQLEKRFKDGTISIPNDRDLVAQLSSIRYEIASEKRLQLVSKEYMRKHGEKSPDRADALALAFYEAKAHNPEIRWL